MAMITIERVLPRNSLQNQNRRLHNNDNVNENNDNNRNNVTNTIRTRNPEQTLRLNEIYIAVRGADIIFAHKECHRYSKNSHTSISELIQAILEILRPQDMMKMAVRLESQLSFTRSRYLLVISNENDQNCLLGIDYENEVTIGIVLPIWNDMKIMLDGDGGFRITTGNRHHIFKPVSVQAMWSIFQALHLATKKSIKNNYYEGGGSHQWVSYYKNNIKSDMSCLHEWYTVVADQSETNYNNFKEFMKPKDGNNFEEVITSKLKEVMVSVDLEQVTSKEIRNKLEKFFQRDLSDYKSYIDKEMIRIMGQLEEPSKILDYLYLGSEWNASNFEELKGKGVQKILNVTSEIDNYFPGYFDYYNIRVNDDEETNMLRHLNDTYYYIRKARDEGVKVLVHCKKGISRSASVVVAYIMKEKSYDLNEALEYVQNKRSTIRPNPAFLEQLEIYQGMLHASKNNMIWKSNSDSELQNSDYETNAKKKILKPLRERALRKDDKENAFKFHRRRSWPPKDKVLFSHLENKILNFNNHDDNHDVIKKSCVKERIENFENKQPTRETKSFNLFRKNIAKNGLVSNLACQFEPKETINDILTVDNGQQQRFLKPPIPFNKAPKSHLDLNQKKYHTINLSRYPFKNELPNRILKRALSFDNILDYKYLNSNDNSLKKCRKSFTNIFNQQFKINDNASSLALHRTTSLPNIPEKLFNTRKRIICLNTFKQTMHLKSSPLDLHCMNETETDGGFVKRRTEELENRHQSLSIITNSMPSSPNLSTEHYIQRKTFFNHKNHSCNHQVKLSKSFNCPSSYNKSKESSTPVHIVATMDNNSQLMKMDNNNKRNFKKTYGKSHPLDKLNRASFS